MKDLDLKNLWESDRQQIRDHYESIPDLLKMARKRSGNILQKIRRNVLIEIVVTVLMLAGFGYIVHDWGPRAFWTFMLVCIGAIGIIFRLYFDLLVRIRRVKEEDITTSLRLYVQIMGRYVKRMKFLVYYILPLSYLGGLSVPIVQAIGEEPAGAILLAAGVSILIGVPFVAFVIWFTNKRYIKWLYGKHYESLVKLLESVESLDRRENGG